MSAITAVHAIQRPNPPLEYNKKAIREHLQHHATNGPAYVQIQATNALARMIGLYEDAKQGLGEVLDQAKDKAKEGGLNFAERVAGLMNGTIKATPEEIKASRLCQDPFAEEEDEEAASKDDDEVP